MERFLEDANKMLCIVQMTNDLPILRACLGLSQEDLAQRVGLSRQTINAIENRKKNMTWTTCMALIAFFSGNEKTQALLEGTSCALDIVKDLSNTYI